MAPKDKRPRSSQQQPQLFWDSHYEAEFSNNEHRKLLSGYHINFQFLLDHGFVSCLEHLRFQKWECFLDIFYDTDTILLRQFYTNLKEKNDKSGNLVSIANGTQVEITALSIAECLVAHSPELSVPELLDGILPTDPSFSRACPSFNFMNVLQSLHDPESVLHTSTSVVELSLENRLLHHILVYTLTPRFGSKSVLSDVDVRMMYLLINHVKVSLPKLIMYHMSKCARTKDNAYPYGMFLTYYLKSLGVSRIPNDATPPSVKYNQYTVSTLGLLFGKRATSWVRKHSLGTLSGASSSAPPRRNVRQTRRKPVCVEEEDEDPTTLDDVHREVAELHEYVSELDHRIFEKLGEMDTRMNERFDKLSEEFKDLRSRLG